MVQIRGRKTNWKRILEKRPRVNAAQYMYMICRYELVVDSLKVTLEAEGMQSALFLATRPQSNMEKSAVTQKSHA